MSQQRTLEQERAKKAWECVQEAKKQGKEYGKKYGSLARSAPADIQANGLGQTLAFWRAKKKEAHCQDLLQHVSGWVQGQMQLGAPAGLLNWIMEQASTDEYRLATSEAMAFLMWLKRFAEAELGEE